MSRFALGVLVGLPTGAYWYFQWSRAEDRRDAADRPDPPGTVLTTDSGRHYSLAELRELTGAIDELASEAATGNTADFGPFETATSVEFLWGDGTCEGIVGVLTATNRAPATFAAKRLRR